MSEWKSFDKPTVEAVLQKSKGRCWYCGKTLTIESRRERVNNNIYVVDHYKAQRNGGGNEISNLVPACWACNNRKKSKTLEEFRETETRIRNNAPKFTDDQLFYLESNKIELPHYEPHQFYFEKEGLQP